MRMLSDDDLDLGGLTDEELAQAWDLWFDLAQATNDSDPAWTHGVFVGLARAEGAERAEVGWESGLDSDAPALKCR
jgi:hypothetical protein